MKQVAVLVVLGCLCIGLAIVIVQQDDTLTRQRAQMVAARDALIEASSTMAQARATIEHQRDALLSCGTSVDSITRSLNRCLDNAQALDGCCNYRPPKGWIQR